MAGNDFAGTIGPSRGGPPRLPLLTPARHAR